MGVHMSTDRSRLRKISVVTICRNAQAYIKETMRSVLDQTAIRSGRLQLEYLVRDGASTDGTIETIRSLLTPEVDFVSRPDKGLYDALAPALQSCSGDIVAYINAGDYYHPRAFDVVLEVMQNSNVEWLTGMTVSYNRRSQVIGVAMPYRYRRDLMAAGMYDGKVLPFIQQESTFWLRRLHDGVEFDRMRMLRYSGDAFLWSQFARSHTLAVVQAQLGGFRFHPGQLSEAITDYRREMQSWGARRRWHHYLKAWGDAVAWRLPPRIKRGLNREEYYAYDMRLDRWACQRDALSPAA